MVAYDLGVPAPTSVEYVHDQPGSGHRWSPGDLGADRSRSRCTTTTRSRSPPTAASRNNWSLQASYRWSRLLGNFEGFYREDNGQSDPGITSLFDFPTNDPSYTAIGAPQFGYRGDIRFLGDGSASGPLPLDRPHQVKSSATTPFRRAERRPAALNVQLGQAAHGAGRQPAVYDNDSEIPTTPRGAGYRDRSTASARGRPSRCTVDVQASYALQLRRAPADAARRRLQPVQPAGARDYDDYTESAFGVANPDFGRILAYQNPFTLRVGARLEF